MSQVTAPVSPARSKWEQAIQRLSEQDRAQLHNVNISPDERRLVLNAVLDTANNRIEECRSKRWKVVVGNHPIYIRDVLEKFSVWVKKLIVIGDIAIQYDPVHAALPWAAMRFIMQTSINDIEAFGEIMVSLENLASIVSQCHVIEAVYLDERKHKTTELSNHITESVISLYAAILQYLVETIKYLDLGTGKRLLRSIGQSQEDFKGKYSPITHALESFGRIAGIAQSSELKHGVDLIEKIEKQLKDRDARDESELGWLKTTMKQLQQPIDRIDTRLGEIEDGLRREIRAKILSATSTIPHGNHHKIHSKDRIKGSGRWFLQRPEFKQWRRSSSPSALWLHGIPGSGKTMLTSLVIDELLGHEHVAYFYCKKNPAEPERAQCDKILGSIVRQLASVGPKLPILDPVLKCYEDAIEGTGKFEDQSWDTDECVQVLLQLFDEYPGVTLVFDALDEVNQESRQELLDTLSDLIQKSTSLIRIFISSRSNYDISLHLAGTPNIYIQADDNAEDISSFIDKKLAEARLLYGKLSPTLRSTIIDTLESGANGMFRWVDLQIQALRPLKLPADITIRLGSLPGTLEELYWEVFQQIRDFGETASRLATFTFQWLLYAKAPMILGGFASLASIALSADPDTDTKFTAAEVLDVCSNLVVERESSFEFAHLSIREFFESLSNRHIYKYMPEEGHSALAQACLLYLDQAPETFERAKPKTKQWSSLDTASGAQHTHKAWAMKRSDFSVGVPSNYIIGWVVYHIDAAGSARRKPNLSKLLKAFLLQPADPASEASLSTVSPGFYVWRDIAVKVGGFEIPIEILKFPASPIWLACEFQWFELVEYLYQNAYHNMDQARTFRHGYLNNRDYSPFWYAVAKRRFELAQCIQTYTTNTSRTLSLRYGGSILEEAARNNDLELIRVIARAYHGELAIVGSAFEEAAQSGHREAMKLMVELSLTSFGQASPNALAAACKRGQVESVKFLTEIMAIEGAEGTRYLDSAASSGHVETVRLLLDRHIGLCGLSAVLTTAVSRGHSEVTALLIAHGAEKEIAALLGKRSTHEVRCLIAAGYDVNGCLSNKWTALHDAAEADFCEVAKELLAHKAEVNAADHKGQTPLHIAAKNGAFKVAKELLAYPAGVNAADHNGQTPLHLATQYRTFTVAKVLLAYKADVNATDQNGQTPLHLAIKHRAFIVTKELLAQGAKVNTLDRYGLTPLHLAAEFKTLGIAKELLAYKAEVNASDNNGQTPLHVAAKNSAFKVAKELLAQGAEVNAADHNGQTPLHLAVKRSTGRVAEELLAHGAEIDAVDHDGQTPLCLATKYGFENCAQILINGGALDLAGKAGGIS